jgi:chromosomal replication initiator protein
MQSWEQFLALQEQELGADTVRKWLRTLRIKDYDIANLFLEARDSFQILWFEEHIRAKLAARLLNVHERPITVHLSLAGAEGQKDGLASLEGKKRPKAAEKPVLELQFETPDPYCTFQNLYVSESNLLAHKILCEVAGVPLDKHSIAHPQSQLAVFNPIYVYGPPGTGKTHLLMATANALIEKGVNALYTRAETFTEHVVQAIRAGEMTAFRRAYRERDVLILDDVHVFSRKTSTQEELFHTFNSLHLDGKQIILAAHCAPQDLQLIEPRLVSRFEWGIVMPLEAIKEQEYLQLIRKKCAAVGFPLGPKIDEFFCKTFKSSPKSMCAALEALILRLHIDGNSPGRRSTASSSLTPTAVRDILEDLIAEEERQTLKPEKIVQAVAESYGIRLEDLFSKNQSREFVTPRQVAMFLCRENLKMPFMKIGDYFKRDHSTVISGIKRVRKDISTPDSDLAVDVNSILRKLMVQVV